MFDKVMEWFFGKCNIGIMGCGIGLVYVDKINCVGICV